jgi:YVTN family beta-propeller protein
MRIRIRGLCTRVIIKVLLGAAVAFFILAGTSSAQQTVTLQLDPKGAYIFTDENPPSGFPADNPDAPLTVSLASLGAQPGDTLLIHVLGDLNYCDPAFCGPEQVPFGVCAVFSSSNTLLPSTNLNRVPGAIAPDFAQVTSCTTLPTLWASLPTDIPQDFILNGRPIKIPPGSQYLFIAVDDSFYADNSDTNGDLKVSITAIHGAAATHAPYAYVVTNTSATCCVQVVDTSTNAVVKSIPTTGNGIPIALTPDQSRLYIADFNNNLVNVIDTASNTLITTIPVGVGANATAIAPNGILGYTANSDGTVTVFSVAANKVVATIPVGFFLGDVTVTPDGSTLYASGGNTVAVINTATNTITSTFTIPLPPVQNAALLGPFLNPSGTLGYINQVARGVSPGLINVISIPSNSIVNTLSTGSSPFYDVFSPDGSLLYVVDAPNNVSVLNTSTNQVIANVAVGTDPASMAITPDGSSVYVANVGDGTLSVIQTSTNTVTATVSLGAVNPFGVAIPYPLAPSLATTLTLNPASLSFNPQLIGVSSAVQNISVMNPGNSAVSLTSVALTGPNPGDYSLTNNCPAPPATLGAGVSCNIGVSSTPTGVGVRTAFLTIIDNNGVANSQQSVPLTGTGTALAPTVTQMRLTYNPGMNVSNVATFNCVSGLIPCPDPSAHSLKITVPEVISPFTLTVTAYEVPLSQADGICQNGQTETTDFDCRFATYFPIQTLGDGDIIVPQCIPYSNGNCVFYRVSDTPPFSSYVGPVTEYIAWNNSAYVPSGIYQANNPRLFDDPGDPPYDINHQFVFDITNYYQPTGEEVGVDAGIGGTTKHFNDFVVAYPGAPKTAYTISWVPPLSSTMTAPFLQGDVINARFSLKPNTPSAVAVTPPERVGYTVVLDSDNSGCKNLTGVRQPTVTPAHWPSEFTYDPVRQIYQLKLAIVYNPGHYKLLVDSPLFPEQCASFVVTK